MKKWQNILAQHHTVEVLSDHQAKVLNGVYDAINKVSLDVTVTRVADGYTDSEGYSYKSIYDYLGY